jgi:cytochrome c5
MQKILLALTVLIFLNIQEGQSATDWQVPDEYNTMVNPVSFTNASVRAGRDLWDKNCKSCHGDPGKYNALALVPPPPDAAAEMMQANTDGAMFYKITYGRGAMPQFETTLSSDDRWKVITFIRKFDPRNEGILTEEELLKGKIYALINADQSAIDIVAEVQQKEGQLGKLANSTVYITARKAFGNLLVGTVTTDEAGRATFQIPAGMRTKSDGTVDFVLTLGDDFEPTTFAMSGVQVKEPVPFIEPARVLWSTNDRTQVWLLFTYFAALIGAWSTIGYIVLQIIKIRKLSQKT